MTDRIHEYIDKKTGKKLYEIKGYYVGLKSDGKEKRIKKKGFATRKAAREYIVKVTEEFNRGSVNTFSNITLEQYCDMLLKSKEVNTKAGTLNKYDIVLRMLPTNLLKMQLTKITTPMLQNFVNEYILKKGYKNSTAKNYTSKLTTIFNAAIKQDIIFKNPMKNVMLPNDSFEKVKNKKEKDILTVEELKLFIKKAEEFLIDESKLTPETVTYDSLHKYKKYISIRLVALSGARKGEVIGFTWDDINVKELYIDINKTLTQARNGRYTYGNTTKTPASTRKLYIDTETMQHLLRLKRLEKVLTKNVFALTYYRSMWKTVEIILRRAGIRKKISPHSFRHTQASILFAAKVDLKNIQERLGHESVQITLDLYTHLQEEQRQETRDKFMDILQA